MSSLLLLKHLSFLENNNIFRSNNYLVFSFDLNKLHFIRVLLNVFLKKGLVFVRV